MPRVTQITSNEYQEIQDNAAAAHAILEEPRFKFVVDMMQATIDYSTSRILNNAVHDVEETTFMEKMTRMFRIPKQEQIDELVGQYKLATKFFADLHFYIQTKEDLDKNIDTGLVKVPKDLNG